MFIPSTWNPDAPIRELHARWRQLQSDHTGLRAIRVTLTASYTIETMVPILGALLADRGLYATFEVAPHDQIYQTLLDAGSTRTDVLLVLPRLEDLCARPLAELATVEPARVEAARAACVLEVDRLASALEEAQRRSGAIVICGSFAPPSSTPLGIADGAHAASEVHLRGELNRHLWTRFAAARGAVFLADVSGAVTQLGSSAAYDARLWFLSRVPYSIAGTKSVAACLARSIAALYTAPAKAIVLDLDDTLWGGVVGEDGIGGLTLGESGLGAAYRAFQAALLVLRAQGFLLCVASKNNEADALEVFDRHPAMLIRREHLSAWRIGWGPKSESLRHLADELSIGLDSLVFLDDSPTEREEVRCALPQVTVPDLPADVAGYVRALRALPALDRALFTAEDRARADQYAAERSRSAGRAASSDPDLREAYLRSLELEIIVAQAADADVERVAQLTQKTNQFNLTTIRRTSAEIAALRSDPRWRVYTMSAHDRFGDYGLTGVLLARGDDATRWEIDTFLLSCRVLGRDVETAFLGAVLRELWAAGATAIEARFVPTQKNAPARDFLVTHGFLPDGDRWLRTPLDAEGAAAPHVRVR
jgi:FkbH-like protein